MNKTEQDFTGEFAEERALLHSADILTRKACESIKKKITPTMRKYFKKMDVEAMEGLAQSIPDCVERFYARQWVEQCKIEVEHNKLFKKVNRK